MTGRIPKDATLWDSGDWIEWHRGVSNVDAKPTPAAAYDRQAHLTALQVSMLQSARSYYQLTNRHLPIYEAIAEVHAAVQFDLPLKKRGDPQAQDASELILHIPPHGPSNTVAVDLGQPFSTLIVVRIKDNFTCEVRMTTRDKLPKSDESCVTINWQALPKRR